MKFAKRYITYFVLFFWLMVFIGLFLVTLVANIKVDIPDANLEMVLREALDQPVKPLTTIELSKITVLDASGRGVSSLEGIEHVSNLTILNLEENQISDVSSLASLKKLKKLNLGNNGLIDLEKANFGALEGIRLEQLELSYNVIITESDQAIWLSDIQILKIFPTLKELNLTENQVSNLSALADLTNLKVLILQDNLVEDISAVAQLKTLKSLHLGYNEVRDLSPLADLNQLTRLDLYGNGNIESILPLASMHQLKYLNLDDVPIGNEITNLENLSNLEELSLSNCQLSDVAALQNLKKLISLNLRDNDIVDLSALAGLTNLETLNMQSNVHAQNISALGQLTNLKKLDMQNVPVGEDVFILENFTDLRFLDVRNCLLTDTSALGHLMANGALQDNVKIERLATVDLRDNPISTADGDDYAPVREYWDNVTDRLPFYLPEYTTLAAPLFSASSGYYDAPFELTLYSDLEDAEIYYTLDGSEPTKDSMRYDAAILMQSRAGEANGISAIEDISPRWTSPSSEIYKATVIRSRVIADDGQAISPIVTHTYLIGRDENFSLPVLSLTTDPANLFDNTFGIYIMGDIYDQFYDPASALNPWEREANYSQVGQAWERPVHIEYFSVDGSPGFAQDASLRINGGATRELPQKSLRIYAACDKGCAASIEYELFPGLSGSANERTISAFKSFILRNSGQDWEKTMFRDAFVQNVVRQTTKLDIQAYQPCIVLLNGEYWGIHNIRERLDEFYLENHYGIHPEDVAILSTNALGDVTVEVGSSADEQDYLEMIGFVETHDLSIPEYYDYIKTQMDVDNYIDYQIAQIYFENYDWPQNNVSFWRKNSSALEPAQDYGHDGRWRWFLYDIDNSFGFRGAETASENSLARAINPSREWSGFLFRSLLENQEFREAFITRFADHLNSTFLPENMIGDINLMERALEPEFEEHMRRWRGDSYSYEAWQNSVDVLRTYAENRPYFVRGHVLDYFDLQEIVNVSLESDDQMGYIRINTLDIQEQTPGVMDAGAWSGIYFKGLPVEITAIPYAGYRFEKWLGLDGEDMGNEQLSITLTDDLRLRATFTKE
ncbi:MAG: CotH kinase family protein [Anaerolineaceae bacterium]|nr:CotH kinase family protein [Anaerolineaceae bacterium]